jgi:hypothetical protein
MPLAQGWPARHNQGKKSRGGTALELWLTFFGVVAAGGLLVFLILRRDRRPPVVMSHAPEEGPRFEAGRRPRGTLRGGAPGGPRGSPHGGIGGGPGRIDPRH